MNKKNYARDISKLIGRKIYEWGAVKTGDPMPVLFAVGKPTATFLDKHKASPTTTSPNPIQKGVRDFVPILCFYDIVADLQHGGESTACADWDGLPMAETLCWRTTARLRTTCERTDPQPPNRAMRPAACALRLAPHPRAPQLRAR